MINKFSILNEAKYFLSGIFQNFLVFVPAKSTLKDYTLCLGNISKDFTINNMKKKKTELK